MAGCPLAADDRTDFCAGSAGDQTGFGNISAKILYFPSRIRAFIDSSIDRDRISKSEHFKPGSKYASFKRHSPKKNPRSDPPLRFRPRDRSARFPALASSGGQTPAFRPFGLWASAIPEIPGQRFRTKGRSAFFYGESILTNRNLGRIVKKAAPRMGRAFKNQFPERPGLLPDSRICQAHSSLHT